MDITLTFYIYLGTSWIEATAAMESMGLLTGWWKDAYQIFGTSWMLCGSVALRNENIWEIFEPWIGRLWKWLFWSLLKRRVWLASVQNFNFHSYYVHVWRWWLPHFFYKYLTEIFFSEYLANNFSPVSNRFINFTKIWAKSGPELSVILEILNAMDRPLVISTNIDMVSCLV